jgi:hypothetical protein
MDAAVDGGEDEALAVLVRHRDAVDVVGGEPVASRVQVSPRSVLRWMASISTEIQMLSRSSGSKRSASPAR